MIKKIVFLFLLSSSLVGSAQEDRWALGLGGIYNFQTNGFGIDTRAYIPLTYRIAVSPQFHYFIPMTIHEFYAGLAIQYSLFPERKWTIYPLISAYYNNWVNYNNFEGTIAKQNNLAPEVGLGLMKRTGCLRPFLEGRYDTKWKEANIHLGILFSFGGCYSRTIDQCPAYQ